MSTTETSSAPSPDHYVVELVSEHGKKRRILGWGSNVDQAYERYDAALREHPHTCVRLRQGKQIIAVRVPEAFVHEPPGREH
jgi:hypothetical protein